MAPGWWNRFQDMLEAGVRQRVTRAGLLYTAAAIAVAIAAFISANNLLFLIFAMMLATLLVSGFVSRLTLAGLELDFALPEHISARRKAPARITILNAKWMTSFSIQLTGATPSVFTSRLYFPALPGRSSVRETVEVEFGRRGVYRESGFEFSTRFPFGFTERRIRVALRRDVLVYPAIEPQPGFDALLSAVAGEIESQVRGRGGDFYRIRPYQHLESARHVDWRATAHTGDLQVREFAREEDPLIEIYLDLSVSHAQESWLEQAIECCAFLVWNASQRDGRLRLRTQNFDLTVPTEGDAYAALKYLALAGPLRRSAVPVPGDGQSCRVVFTAQRPVFERAGWERSLFVEPGSLPAKPS